MDSTSRKFFRFILRLAPRRFRDEYGLDVLETLDRRAVELAREERTGPLVWFHLREGAGLLAVVLRERLAVAVGALRTDWRETMGTWVQEIRQATRRLLRSPTFTLASMLTLALGIGANAAIFSVVNAVLLQPLSYPESEELAFVLQEAPGLDLPRFPMSLGAFVHYRSQSRTFEEMAALQDGQATLSGHGAPEYVESTRATWTVFRVLGQTPLLGRLFVEADGRPGSPRVAVISEDLWVRRFGRSPDVLGRSLTVSGEPTEVVGVVADGSLFAESDLWLPLQFDPATADAQSHGYMGVGRLAEGSTLEGARREMAELVSRLPEALPDTYSPQLMEQARIGAVVRDLKEEVVGDTRQALWVVLGTVGLVLLIACANVANLFIVRAEGRQREVAIRRALGAGRGSLLRFFTGEALILAFAGGLAGLGLAWGSVRWLVRTAPPGIPRLSEVGLDGWVLGFAAVVTLSSAILFGVLPMARFAAQRHMQALRDGGRSGGQDNGSSRTRDILVVGQVALALILLVGSGLMVRSFASIRSLDPGFDPEGAASFRLRLSEADYPEPESVARFYQTLVERVRALPGVEAAGATRHVPLSGGIHGSNLRVEGRQAEDEQGPPVVVMTKQITEGYFQAMGMRLVAGREVQRRDHEARDPVMLVNTAVAERFWPGEDPLGKRATTHAARDDERWYTVVGVVESVRDQELTGDPDMVVYYPMLGYAEDDGSNLSRSMSLVYRTGEGGAPLALLPAVRQEVWGLDRNLPLAAPRTLTGIVADAMSRTSFTMVLLALAAGISLVLGAVGLFGVVSYVVNRKTHEIGIRMAVGAQEAQVRNMILGQGGKLVALGALLGLGGSLALGRVVEALLFGVSAADPVTYGGVTALLALVSLGATWLPARRATRIDPVQALRGE